MISKRKNEIYFSQFKIGVTYQFRIHNLLRPKLKDAPLWYGITTKYLVWRAAPLKHLKDPTLIKGKRYWINFPFKSFKIAWERASDYERLEKKVFYDCELKFRRESKKKLVIISRKYFKIKKPKSGSNDS